MVALVDAEHDHHRRGARARCGDRLGHRPGHHHRLLVEAHVLGARDAPAAGRRRSTGSRARPSRERRRAARPCRPRRRRSPRSTLSMRAVRRVEVRRELHGCSAHRCDCRHAQRCSGRRHCAVLALAYSVQVLRMNALSLAVQQDEVEHVERVDRPDAGDQRRLRRGRTAPAARSGRRRPCRLPP